MKRILYCLLFAITILMYSLPASAGTYDAWKYKMKIRVTNNGTFDATDYPVRIRIPGNNLVESGHANKDMSDLRFSDSAGNPLPFWIEPTDKGRRNVQNLAVWVRLKTFNKGENIIYLHTYPSKQKTDLSPVVDALGNYTTGDYYGDLSYDGATLPYSSYHLNNPNSPYDYYDRGSAFNTFYRLYKGFGWQSPAKLYTSNVPEIYQENLMSRRKYGSPNNSLQITLRTAHDTGYTSASKLQTYFLVQGVTAKTPALDTRCGYKLVVDHDYTPDSSVRPYTDKDISYNKLRLLRRSTLCSDTTTTEGWVDVVDPVQLRLGGYVNAFATGYYDIRVTRDKIKLSFNGDQKIEFDRGVDSDDDGIVDIRDGVDATGWTEGHVGAKNSNYPTVGWEVVFGDYVGAEPVVEFLTDTDAMIKREQPTADSSFTGSDIIESSAGRQILEDRVNGNVYSITGTSEATADQIFKGCLRIRNIGSEAADFKIDLKRTGGDDWSVTYSQSGACGSVDPDDYKEYIASGGTTTTGTVNIPSGGVRYIDIQSVPSASALVKNDKLTLVYHIESQHDFSFDDVRFENKIIPKYDCDSWTKKQEINITYEDKYGTGDLIDYQVLVQVGYDADGIESGGVTDPVSGIFYPGTAYAGDGTTAGGSDWDLTDAKDDGSDIIFTDEEGGALPFWTKRELFSKNPAKGAWWVNVNRIKSGGIGTKKTTKIYMWYGNSTQTSASNEKDTFLLWEDFNSLSPVGQDQKLGCPDGGQESNCTGQPNDDIWKNNPEISGVTTNNFNNWYVKSSGSGHCKLQKMRWCSTADVKFYCVPSTGRNTARPEQVGDTCEYSNNYVAKTDGTAGPNLSVRNDISSRWYNYEVIVGHSTTGATYPSVLFTDHGNNYAIKYYDKDAYFIPNLGGNNNGNIDGFNVEASHESYLPGYTSFPVFTTWTRARVFHYPPRDMKNPENTRLNVKVAEKMTWGTDRDYDDPDFSSGDPSNFDHWWPIGNHDPDPYYRLDSGGFAITANTSGFTFDDVRVRNYTDPEPVLSYVSTPIETGKVNTYETYAFPAISPAAINKRQVLLNATVSESGVPNLTAVYADCFLKEECEAGEDSAQQGTISIWGKINDSTPKGVGEHLTEKAAADRTIFTAYDANSDNKISGCSKIGDPECPYFNSSNAEKLNSLLVGSPTDTAITTNVINFVRGEYVTGSDYEVSDTRNVSDPLYKTAYNTVVWQPSGCTGSTVSYESTCQWKLGQIIHSSPLVVGPPNMNYGDSDYFNFKSTYDRRDMVVYFNSNEGMVHAIRLSTCCGKDINGKDTQIPDSTATELWAFVPNAVLPKLKESAGTAVMPPDYLADGLLRAIDIKNAEGSLNADGTNYRTVLVGGLREGGQGLFAIDVSEPTEPKLMWEINTTTTSTDVSKIPNLWDNIGNTWSAPALGRLCEKKPCDLASNNTNKWVAVLGSGNGPDATKNQTRNAYLTIVDLENGAVIKQIKVSNKIKNITTNIGVIRDASGYITKVFFGDSCGAVWRIDGSRLVELIGDPNISTLEEKDMLFSPDDYETFSSESCGASMPVNSQPAYGYDGNYSGHDVFRIFFGTGTYGEFVEGYPYQKFYGLKDDRLYLADDDPYFEKPYLINELKSMTKSTETNSGQSWYIKLGVPDDDADENGSEKNSNERVLNSPVVNAGHVYFTTYSPSHASSEGTICSDGGGAITGTTRFYGVGFDTGMPNSNLMTQHAGMRSVIASTGDEGAPSTPLIYGDKALIEFSKGEEVIIDLKGEDAIDTNTTGRFLEILLWRRIR